MVLDNLRLYRAVLGASQPLHTALQSGDVGLILEAATHLGQAAAEVGQALTGQVSSAFLESSRNYQDGVTQHLEHCCFGIVSSVNLMFEAVEILDDGSANVDLDHFHAALGDVTLYVDQLGDAF